MKRQRVLKWTIFSIALLINLFILVNSFIFGEASAVESNSISSTAANAINGISPSTITNENMDGFFAAFRKVIGHFTLFGLSGFFTTWSFYLFARGTKLNYFLHFGCLSLIGGLAFAWITEFVQLFIPGRNGTVKDVMINFSGYFIGVLLVIFVFFLAKCRIFTKPENEEK